MLPRVNYDVVEGISASLNSQKPGGYMQKVHDHMLENNPTLLLYIQRAVELGDITGQNTIFIEGMLYGIYDMLRVQDEVNELEM